MSQVATDATGKGGTEDKSDRVKEKAATIECQYALLEFEKPVTCLPDSITIGSRLDTDVHIHLTYMYILYVLCSTECESTVHVLWESSAYRRSY